MWRSPISTVRSFAMQTCRHAAGRPTIRMYRDDPSWSRAALSGALGATPSCTGTGPGRVLVASTSRARSAKAASPNICTSWAIARITSLARTRSGSVPRNAARGRAAEAEQHAHEPRRVAEDAVLLGRIGHTARRRGHDHRVAVPEIELGQDGVQQHGRTRAIP